MTRARFNLPPAALVAPFVWSGGFLCYRGLCCYVAVVASHTSAAGCKWAVPSAAKNNLERNRSLSYICDIE